MELRLLSGYPTGLRSAKRLRHVWHVRSDLAPLDPPSSASLRSAPSPARGEGVAGPAPDLQQTVAKLLASRIRTVMSSTGRLDEQRDAGFIGSFGTPFAGRVVTASAAPLARDRLGWRMRSWPAPRCASSHGRDERMCEPHASTNYFAPGETGSAVPVCV